MRALAFLLPFVLGACSLGDCGFDRSRSETVGGVLLADGSGVGDTLTVAFVVGTYPLVEVAVADGLGDHPEASPDEVAEIFYDATAFHYPGGDAALPFVTSVRGDTGFVYLEGSLDPSIFVQACTPAEASVEVRVRDLLVPQGVLGARVAAIPIDAIPTATAAVLRQSDAARRAARPITT